MATKMLSIFFCLTIFTVAQLATKHADALPTRSKRSVRDLYDMMSDMLTVHKPQDFIGYGHYCGLPVNVLGKDNKTTATPVDALDECCQQHQICGTNAAADDSCYYGYGSQAALPYRYSITMNATNSSVISCKPYDLSPFGTLVTTFLGWTSACGLRLCTCDRDYTLCTAQHETEFNSSYADMRSVIKQTIDVVPDGESLFQKVRLGVKLLDGLLSVEGKAGGAKTINNMVADKAEPDYDQMGKNDGLASDGAADNRVDDFVGSTTAASISGVNIMVSSNTTDITVVVTNTTGLM